MRPPKTLNASDFKARCLAILDDVERTGEGVVILKRGRRVARLTSAREAKPRPLRDRMKGTVEREGDVVAPPLSAEDWAVHQTRRVR